VYEIELKLWHNDEEKNWTAEINGRRYEPMAIEWIHAHLHGVLLDAEESLVGIATELYFPNVKRHRGKCASRRDA
jgi:hypothetical protein